MRTKWPILLLAALAYAAGSLLIYSFHISAPTLGAPHPSYAGAQAPALLIEPRDGIAPVLAAIASASSSVDLVMYELEDLEVEQALTAASARGAQVRVLLNPGYYGAQEKANQNAYQFLAAHDVPVRWTPGSFALTHQKTLIIDGKKALIMTFNFTPQYYATSRDFGIVDTDQKDIAAIENAFAGDWSGALHTPSAGDDLIWSPGASSELLATIAGAKQSLDIYNEEMDDQSVTNALVAAAKRGANVRIVMTYQSSWRSAFKALSAAGAQVHTFGANAPLSIHAKMIIADQALAFVGSQNFSPTSLEKNRELGIFLTDPGTLQTLAQVFNSDFQSAQPFAP